MTNENDTGLQAFLEALSSSAPTPGGGGAAAYAGALGSALCSMVGALTSGKKKYADVQEDIERLMRESAALSEQLYGLIAQDAEDFLPLAKAYGLPKDSPEQAAHKEAVLEEALFTACQAPLAIMRSCFQAILLQEEMAEKGSRLAVSDAGAGAALLRGALQAASLNIFINARSMKDREKADALTAEAEKLLAEGTARAEAVFSEVLAQLRH